MSGALQCGSEDWFLSIDTYRPYVKGSCQNGAPFSSFSPLTCLCPAAADISPCACDYYDVAASKSKVAIDCSSRGLNDTRMAAIVGKIPAPAAALYKMTMDGNQLTRVPQGLAQFIFLSVVDLSSNAITSVASGALAFPAQVETINLAKNTITALEPSSLPGAHYSVTCAN